MKLTPLLLIALISLSVVLSACNVSKELATGNDNVNTQDDDLTLENNTMPNDIGTLDDIPVEDSIPE